jgi:hypothetical protein
MKEQQIQEALAFSIRLLEEYAPDSHHIQTLEAMVKDRSKLDITDWYNEWLALWPTKGDILAQTGQRLTYSPRVTAPDGIKRMKRFLQELFNGFCPSYKHLSLEERLDVIFEATDNYLKERKADNWKFIKKSTKFIFQIEEGTRESILGEYIEGKNEKKKRSNFEYTI